MSEEKSGAECLVEAFTIFSKYSKAYSLTHCTHDVLLVCVEPKRVSTEDRRRLDELGFCSDSGEFSDCFYSYRFGSA